MVQWWVLGHSSLSEVLARWLFYWGTQFSKLLRWIQHRHDEILLMNAPCMWEEPLHPMPLFWCQFLHLLRIWLTLLEKLETNLMEYRSTSVLSHPHCTNFSFVAQFRNWEFRYSSKIFCAQLYQGWRRWLLPPPVGAGGILFLLPLLLAYPTFWQLFALPGKNSVTCLPEQMVQRSILQNIKTAGL
jgi:hypothetical protein